jgi:hypothetical protein
VVQQPVPFRIVDQAVELMRSLRVGNRHGHVYDADGGLAQ